MKNFPKARVSDLVTSEIGDEVLVYDLKTNKCHCLNKTAYFIWKHCDGQTDIVEIANRVDGKSPAESMEKLTISTLAKLEKAELLDDTDKYRILFAQTSRREMMRLLGLAGTVALPMVSSVVAPTAAQAQSVCPTGIICRGNCCSQGEGCASSVGCCPTAKICGNSRCCTSDQSCGINTNACCPNANFCLDICCPSNQTCVGTLVGTCCPPANVCGNDCCPGGFVCSNGVCLRP